MSFALINSFIEDAGNMTQSLGAGRVIGQLYAYLYFSDKPRNLVDMQDALAISKGSASTAVRQLEQWGAVRKVWVKGDRKDYYTASDWFGHIIKSAILDTVAKKLSSYSSLLEEVEADLDRIHADDPEGQFIRDRIAALRSFHKKAAKVWSKPIVRKLLR